MENDFLEERGILAGIRAEDYVEWSVTTTVHVYSNKILVHCIVVQVGPERRRSNYRIAPVSANVRGENEVLVGGEE